MCVGRVIVEQRAASNEALFREVNENIARLEEGFGETMTEPAFVCECAQNDCTEQLGVDLENYQRVREDSRRFFVIPGHERLELECIVETHGDYLVVEKTGEAGEVAEQAQT